MEEKIRIGCIIFLVGMLIGLIIMNLGSNKFCPECGRHYGSKLEYCPIDGIELKEIAKS